MATLFSGGLILTEQNRWSPIMRYWSRMGSFPNWLRRVNSPALMESRSIFLAAH